MQKARFEEIIEAVVAGDPRFHRDAYAFVREALEFTQAKVADGGREPPRHVTGQELLQGIRRYALEQFGPMTLSVFDAWGLRQCEDFGEIVFNLVEHRILSKTDRDDRADFKGGYTFEEAFRRPFLPASRAGSRRARLASRPE